MIIFLWIILNIVEVIGVTKLGSLSLPHTQIAVQGNEQSCYHLPVVFIYSWIGSLRVPRDYHRHRDESFNAENPAESSGRMDGEMGRDNKDRQQVISLRAISGYIRLGKWGRARWEEGGMGSEVQRGV